MSQELVLQRVHLIDGTSSPVQGPVDILVRDGQVAQVAPHIPPSPRAQVRRLEGLYVVPGLMDAHVHLTSSGRESEPEALRRSTPTLLTLLALENAHRTLQAGFTTVRDAMADFGVAIDLGRAVEAGQVEGPSIYAAGQGLSITGGHGDPQNGWPEEAVHLSLGAVVDGPDEVRRETRRQIRRGAKAIKLFATGGVLSYGDQPRSRGLTEAEMRAAVEEAHNVGIKVLAHAQGTEGIKNAIRAGVDSIDHGIYLDEEAADMMAERGVALVPTLTAVEQIVRHAGHPSIPPWAVEKAKAARERHWASVRLAVERGVRIVLGTDAGTPFNLHGENGQELRYLVAAGLSPMQALLAATRYAAELLGSPAGVVAEGRPADLVVTDANPLEDMEALADPRHIRLVVARGRVVALRRGRTGPPLP
jgi:imidazolonepropionase-like amidohydrolase